MAKLLVYRGETFDRTVDLGQRTIKIGRGGQNDLDLTDPDKSVSRAHAELRFEDGHYSIVDLNSSNGVWVAGRRVQEARIEPRVVVAVGAFRLMLEEEPAPAGSAAAASSSTHRSAPPRVPVELAARKTSATESGRLRASDAPGPPGPAPPRPVAAGTAPGPAPVRAEAARPADAGTPRAPTAAAAPTRAKRRGTIWIAAAAVVVIGTAAAGLFLWRARPPILVGTESGSATAPAKPSGIPATSKTPTDAASPTTPQPLTPTGGPAAAATAVLPSATPSTPPGSPRPPETPQTRPRRQPTAGPPAPLKAQPALVKPQPAPAKPQPAAPPGGQPALPSRPTGAAEPVATKQPPTPQPPPPAKPPRSVPADPKAQARALQQEYMAGKQAIIRGDYLAAITSFESVLKVDPEYLDTVAMLGIARGGAKNAAQLEVDSGNKAELYGEWAEAVKRYERARQLDPTATSPVDGIARVRARMQSEGEELFRQARQYDAAGRAADAIATYEKALQLLPPDHPSAKAAVERIAALRRNG